MQHFSVTMANLRFGAGLVSGCGMGEARPDGTIYAITKFGTFILFIIYEKPHKFNVFFRQDIPTDFVQLRLTYIKVYIPLCAAGQKKAPYESPYEAVF